MAEKNVVMTGFGQTHLLPPDSSLVSSWQGSSGYIGPEFGKGKPVCGFKMESYSLGVLLWYMAIRDDDELSEEVYSPDLLRNGCPERTDSVIKKLLCRLLASNPTKKATVHDVIQILNGRIPGQC